MNNEPSEISLPRQLATLIPKSYARRVTLRKPVCAIVAVTLLLLGSQANANFGCNGYLTAGEAVRVTADGYLFVNPEYRNDWIQMCNINETWNGVHPRVCAAWVATAQRAANANMRVRTYYNFDTFDCATIPLAEVGIAATYFGLRP